MRFVFPLNCRQVTAWGTLRLAALLLTGFSLANTGWADPGESKEKKAPEAAQQNPFGEQSPPAAGDDPFGAAVGDPFANAPAAKASRPAIRARPARSKRVRDALDQETKIAFIDTPLEEVVQYLKQLHGIEIMLDHAGLKTANITPDMPITRHIEGLTLREALDIVLLDHGLHYQNRGTWLLITTEAGVDKWIGEQLAAKTRVSFTDVPLLETVATLARIHHVPVDIEISTAAGDGFKKGKVTIQREEVTLSEALTEILSQHDLRYERRQGRLWIVGEGKVSP
ncbi:MAG: STN domain-containing protein [Pirellulaceae bacterium]